ncbi:hypothetical protein DFQ26_008298 [Actinomortierella ambigua]|nr:hypothetical protein DFQ26_008298 [Actinomortierella ambigua]
MTSLLPLVIPIFRGTPSFGWSIDEAQILSDKSPTSFTSSASQSDLRPMLSPLLSAFRSVGLRDELKIIYAGTGLSIRTLHWALSSGDGVKEYGSNSFPYLEFPGTIVDHCNNSPHDVPITIYFGVNGFALILCNHTSIDSKTS